MKKSDKRLPATILLSAISYTIQESEGLIVFAEEEPVWGCKTRFSFERHCLCWYLTVHSESGVMFSHAQQAYEAVVAAYGGNNVSQQ